jgi:hypothetical protein
MDFVCSEFETFSGDSVDGRTIVTLVGGLIYNPWQVNVLRRFDAPRIIFDTYTCQKWPKPYDNRELSVLCWRLHA